MRQEDESLLLQDLSARLPYGVKISKTIDDFVSESTLIRSLYPNGIILVESEFPDVDAWDICEIKPYLRPLSSMTEEEKKELGNYAAATMFASQNKNPLLQLTRAALVGDFFNKHHFDYRGLIEKGLALEAPKDMYK